MTSEISLKNIKIADIPSKSLFCLVTRVIYAAFWCVEPQTLLLRIQIFSTFILRIALQSYLNVDKFLRKIITLQK